jgi:ribosomal protein S1
VEFTQEQWDDLMARHPPGTPVSGTVTGCHRFGVFVRLDQLPDVPALLELIHFRQVEAEPDHRIEYPADYPPVGARVEARVLGWCLKPNDVRLTQLSHLDWSHLRWLADWGRVDPAPTADRPRD